MLECIVRCWEVALSKSLHYFLLFMNSEYAAHVLYTLAAAIIFAILTILIFCPIDVPFRRCFFDQFYTTYEQLFLESIAEYKKTLFHDFSNAGQAVDRGSTRILEIGGGPRYNFEYYPKNQTLMIIEPNLHFKHRREDNSNKTENIVVEDTIFTGPEDLSKLEDNSMNAVVATFVMCSAHKINVVLKEIHRVLKPNGKYYFMEHGQGTRSKYQWAIRTFGNCLWQSTFDGCSLSNNNIQEVKTGGLFENVVFNTFAWPATEDQLARYFLDEIVYGTAQKPNTTETNEQLEKVEIVSMPDVLQTSENCEIPQTEENSKVPKIVENSEIPQIVEDAEIPKEIPVNVEELQTPESSEQSNPNPLAE
ncbi:hypothetical protein CHUAL_008269 [Chamberlinius hualienensis]